MKPIYFLIESLWVFGALGPENLQRVFNVLFFFCSNCRKSLAEASRSRFPDARITCHGERFEHDLLNDQAGDEVALCDAAYECLANTLPILRVDIAGNIHPDLESFGRESCSVSLFALGVFQGL